MAYYHAELNRGARVDQLKGGEEAKISHEGQAFG